MTTERLVVSAVTVLSALNRCSDRHDRCACDYLSAFCILWPGVMLQISVQTEQELFEQMHFFDDPFSSCCRRTMRFECRI